MTIAGACVSTMYIRRDAGSSFHCSSPYSILLHPQMLQQTLAFFLLPAFPNQARQWLHRPMPPYTEVSGLSLLQEV